MRAVLVPLVAHSSHLHLCFSLELSADQPECPHEAGATPATPESSKWGDGQQQPDAPPAAADGEGEAETEAPRTASAGEAAG